MDVSGIRPTYDVSAFQRLRAKSEEIKKDSKLSEDEQKKVKDLKKRDQEVKEHEQAHQRAAGALAGPPKYEYETGPDGKQYAVGGSVSLNTSRGRTPEETISRAQTVRRAALAPKDPSTKDRQVAMEASQMEAEARAEMLKDRQQVMQEYVKNMTSSNSPKITQQSDINTAPKIENNSKDQEEDAEIKNSVSGIKNSELDFSKINFDRLA